MQTVLNLFTAAQKSKVFYLDSGCAVTYNSLETVRQQNRIIQNFEARWSSLIDLIISKLLWFDNLELIVWKYICQVFVFRSNNLTTNTLKRCFE